MTDESRQVTKLRRSPLWRSRKILAVIFAATAFARSSAAAAHLFVGDGGPGAGFIHPLTGPDHLLAMFTVGLLSARLGGSAIWRIPAAFLTGMVVGGALGIGGFILTGSEAGVAISVVVLGAMLIIPDRRTLPLALGATCLFGLFHGYAHGAEMPRVAVPGFYALGFLSATGGLHLMGALSGLLVECRSGAAARFRAAGVALVIAGLFFVSQLGERPAGRAGGAPAALAVS